jgi:hypothetical protein
MGCELRRKIPGLNERLLSVRADIALLFCSSTTDGVMDDSRIRRFAPPYSLWMRPISR